MHNSEGCQLESTQRNYYGPPTACLDLKYTSISCNSGLAGLIVQGLLMCFVNLLMEVNNSAPNQKLTKGLALLAAPKPARTLNFSYNTHDGPTRAIKRR